MKTLILLLVLVLLSACGGFSGSGAETTRPEDFQVRYEFAEGSLPPPYYYQYSLQIGPGEEAEISMTPDYPGEGVPTWTETFTLTAAEVDALYQQLVSLGLLSTRWAAEDDPPVGGSRTWLEALVNGREIRVPPYPVSSQRDRAGELLEAVQAVVPQDILDGLLARRESYMEAHPDR